MGSDGKMSMPRTDSGMNKIAPTFDRDKTEPLGREKGKSGKKVLERARKRMERCISNESDNRKAALDDRKFLAGQQWPDDVAAQRNMDRRPCLTVNKLPTFVHQVVNDLRQNRPAIHVSPVGDKSDKDTAQMYTGLIKSIERDSAADIAYDTATECAVVNGFGYWRVLTEYQDHDTFDQVIHIKRIRNPFTVYLDPDHQEPDAADIKFAFISEMVPRDEFKAEWPDADYLPYTLGGIGEKFKEWVDQECVRVAEYFEITHKTRTLVSLSNGHVGWKDELHDLVNEDIEGGAIEILAERESQVPKVMHYKITAKEILEESEWPGRWIPIVKIIGDEVDIEGKVKLSGVIRHAKDSQRMYNYWRTAETELIALAPKAPWVLEEGQVEGHEAAWGQANTKSFPFLQYKGTTIGNTPAPPPQRQQFAGVPAGVIQAAMGAAEDMQATTGIRFDASKNERMMDESGVAIKELRRSGDVGSFHYADNLARSLRRTGHILIDLIPKVYDSRRVVMVLREDDKEERVTVDPTASRGQKATAPDGKPMRVFNPTDGDYAVTVTVGPSYATKRIEAADSMMKFVAAVPNAAAVIPDLIAKNMDWPGAEQISARLAKTLPPNLLAPEPKDMTPQTAALLQSLQAQLQKLNVEKMQLAKALQDKNADRALIQDKTDKDFEAKLLAVVQKQEAAHAKEIGAKLTDLAEQVKAMVSTLNTPVTVAIDAKPGESKPDAMGEMADFTGEV